MRLHSVHIENYGRLHDHDRSFRDGLEAICAPNGSGKTTLASFICAMFYGLEDTRRKSGMNERQHYRPWGGGAYGGSMVFSEGNTRYRVQRTFGTRKKEDTFLLYDDRTGMPSRDYGEDLGQALFGVDAEAFLETVLHAPAIRQGVVRPETNRTKAGTVIGPAPALSAPSTRIRAMITDAEGEDEALRSCENAIQQLKKDAETLRPDRKNSAAAAAADRQASLQALALRVPALQEQAARLEKQLSETKAQIAAGDEEQARLQERLALTGRAMEADRLLQAHALEEQQHTLKVQEAERLRAQLETVRIRADEILSQEEQSLPDSGDTPLALLTGQRQLADERCRTAAAQCSRLEREYRETLNTGRSLQEEYRTKKGQLKALQKAVSHPLYHPVLRAGLGAFCILLLFFAVSRFPAGPSAVSVITGIPAALSGAAAVLLTVWHHRQQRQYEELQQAASDDRRSLLQLRSRADSLSVSLKTERTHLRSLQQEAGRLRREEEAGAGTPRVRALRSRRQALEEEILRLEQALQRAEAERDAYTPSLSPQQLNALRAEADLAADETSSLPVLTQEAAVLQEEQARYRSAQEALSGELENTARQLEEAEQAAAQAQQLDQVIADHRHRYRILTAASECLQQASYEYNRRFMHPFLQTFEHYCDLLRSEPLLFRSDADLAVHAEAQGLPRSLDSFSTGAQDLLLLCRRLALLDCMFGADQPPLILDDPFVNLDDEHLAAALRLLDTLAEDRQIIYLTCREDRMPS